MLYKMRKEMKTMKKLTYLTLLCTAAMLFSACSQNNQPSQSSQANTDTELQAVTTNTEKPDAVQTSSEAEEESTAAENTSKEEAIPELTLLDGTKAAEDEIVKFEKADRFNQSHEDYYTVNVCFCVPFGTSSDKRTAFEKGSWVKLEEGTEINGFTVEKAEADYFQPVQSENYPFLPVKLVQRVALKGNFTCVGEAYKSFAPDGTATGEIVIVPDNDTLKKLFSLKPALKSSEDYREFEDTDNYFENEEKVTFYISDETTGFQQIMDELSSSESVKVKLEADSFEISYTFETGNSHDGSNVGDVNGGTVSLAA